MQAGLKQQLLQAACQAYRATGHFNYHWARGKLGGDPLFGALLEQELLVGRHRILDLGCGRGLLAAWFLAAENLTATSDWKPGFAVPADLIFEGVDLQGAACAAGNLALQTQYGARVQLHAQDMCTADLQGFDTITIFDALHYLPHEQQERLLDRLGAALPPGGLLLLRVGNAEGGWRFRFSQWVDQVVALAQGLRAHSLTCRGPLQWCRALQDRGFAVETQPMHDGTPFANVLLSARRPS